MKSISGYFYAIFLAILSILPISHVTGDEHPNLILTKNAVSCIQEALGKYPLLDDSWDSLKKQADLAVAAGISVPVPMDPGGGYTHEKHKENYRSMYACGVAYQITREVEYLKYVEEMLLEYASMYPSLGLHPEKKNQAPGKLFWQGLNEAVWLVYSIQAYDCIVEFLDEKTQQTIENDLFRNVCEFFLVDNQKTFDRIHNHATWSVAAVGMTGIVIGDDSYVQRALMGTALSGESGFLRQIELLFSPDGFYAEGPYYQRYALMPFIVFAQALDRAYPDLHIFEHKGGVLVKAVETLLQLTDSAGRFYPINDSILSKDWLTPELIVATNLVYQIGEDPRLLAIAQKHGQVELCDAGLAVAKAVFDGKSQAFERESGLISDGPEGTLGGLALLRHQNDTTGEVFSVLFKATSQGMGHGHFDRLSYLAEEAGRTIISDYGSARFINVVQKEGGRYLPENKSWAKQTVAHHTVVVDAKSQFSANVKEASDSAPTIVYSSLLDDVKIVRALDNDSYDGIKSTRTLMLIEDQGTPFLIDVFRVSADDRTVMLDLPFSFEGEVIHCSFDYESDSKNLSPLGKSAGYQHLWNVAHSTELGGHQSVTWMNQNRFYTWTTITDESSELHMTRLGANDPQLNLRSVPGLVLRQPAERDHSFVSVLEPHGSFDPASERVVGSESQIAQLSSIDVEGDVRGVRLVLKNGNHIECFFSLYDEPDAEHCITIEEASISWKGNFFIRKF